MRLKPGVPYEIRYGLIEGDVLFPDHALVLTNGFRPLVVFYQFYSRLASHLAFYSARLHYVTWTQPFHSTLDDSFEGLMGRDRVWIRQKIKRWQRRDNIWRMIMLTG